MQVHPAPRSDEAESNPGDAQAGRTTSAPGMTEPVLPRGELGLPEEFGRYRILKKLGQGGMGTVYLAHDGQLDRRVALKVPNFTPEDGPEVLERFYREARSAATIEHPNLCPIYDVSQINGIHYLSMAFIDGKPLSAYIRGGRGLPQRQAALVARKLALALEEAHRHGIIHRDLKPSNVMINSRHEPVVMDFGLAKRLPVAGRKGEDARLTQSGAILGTPAYMSPEQVTGDPDSLGPPTDIYSLGVILYEMLVGELPFRGPIPAVLGQILSQEPPPLSPRRPDIDSSLEAICRRAMAKNPEDRFATMAELADALTGYLKRPQTGSSAEVKRPTPASDAGRTREGAARLLAELGVQRDDDEPRLLEETFAPPARPSYFWRAASILAALAAFALLGLIIYLLLHAGKEDAVEQVRHVVQELHLDFADDPGVVVSLDGKELPPKELEKGVEISEPGEHELEVRKGGRVIKKEPVVVRPGQVVQLKRRPRPAEDAGPPAVAQAPSPVIVLLPGGPRVVRPRPRPEEPKDPRPPEEKPSKDKEEKKGPLPTDPPKLPSDPPKLPSDPPKLPNNPPRLPPARQPDPITVISEQGDAVEFPSGEISWADTVIGFMPGNPIPARLTDGRQTSAAVGKPDSNGVPIGPGGEIVLEFRDNLLVDGPGHDLAVFQRGHEMQPLQVFVGNDLKRWILVGEISSKPTIDIAAKGIKPGDSFRLVKLVVHGSKISGEPREPSPRPPINNGPIVVPIPGNRGQPPTRDGPKPGTPPPGGGMAGFAGMQGGFGGGGFGGFAGVGGGGKPAPNDPKRMPGGYGNRGGGGGRVPPQFIIIPGPATTPVPVPAPPAQPALEIDAIGAVNTRPRETGKPAPRGMPAQPTVEPPTVREERRLEGHTHTVTSISFGPDCKHALSAGVDRTLRLWNLETGEEIRRFEGHTGTVCCAAFSPDGALAISGGGVADAKKQTTDGSLRLWNVATGDEVQRFAGHPGGVAWCAAFTRDGKHVLSASPTDVNVRMWNVQSGREVRSYPQKAGVWALALSPDGGQAAAGDQDGRIRVWNIDSGTEVALLMGHKKEIMGLAFLADGRQLISGSLDATLRVWHLSAKRQTGHWTTASEIRGLALSPRQDRVLTGHADKLVRLWKLEPGGEVARLAGHTESITSVAFSPDGTRALSAGTDKTVRVWVLPETD